MSFERFQLRENPFRMTPALSAKEIIWAGFPEIKAKFETRIKRSMKIPNSSLVLNWGEYGSGKTHALRYFAKDSVLLDLSASTGEKRPVFIYINLSKGKNPAQETFISIIDKIDLESVRFSFKDIFNTIHSYIDILSDNIHIRSILKVIFSDYDLNKVKKYLYGLSSVGDMREFADKANILRKLTMDADYSKLISGLFSCLTYEKKIFSCVVLWVDEFEDIAILSNVNIEKTNNFLRELLDNTPNNLLLFLNLTQTALLNVEDLSQYISEAVKSRIKERIQFEIPSRDDFIQYLSELLSAYRIAPPPADPLFPFEKDAVNDVLQKLENASLRRLNEAFSLLLDLADLDGIVPITVGYIEQNKAEIIGWKG